MPNFDFAITIVKHDCECKQIAKFLV